MSAAVISDHPIGTSVADAEALCVTLIDGSEHALKLSTDKSARVCLHELMLNDCTSELNRPWLACESGAWVLRSAIVAMRVTGSART
jgi:hypothetical protein